LSGYISRRPRTGHDCAFAIFYKEEKHNTYRMISKISDAMTRNVITIDKNATVMEAVNIMSDKCISCVVVVNRKEPVGIITERDMVRRVLRNALDPREVWVKDVMTSPLITISGDRKITYAIEMMHTYHFRRIVIASEKNVLEGILTQSDILLKVHKTQVELESMNENLRKSISSLKRYSRIGAKDARVKDLKKKVRILDKELKKVKKNISPLYKDSAVMKPRKK
jgi:CBS domain-containing protein